jgi:hypothetical protein
MKTLLHPQEVLLRRRMDGAYFKAKQEWVSDRNDARLFANEAEAELFCVIANVGGVEFEPCLDDGWQPRPD